VQPISRLLLRRDFGDAFADLCLEEGLGTRPPEQQGDTDRNHHGADHRLGRQHRWGSHVIESEFHEARRREDEWDRCDCQQVTRQPGCHGEYTHLGEDHLRQSGRRSTHHAIDGHFSAALLEGEV